MIKFVDLTGKEITREDAEKKNNSEGRWKDKDGDPYTLVWSPWDSVPAGEMENPPQQTRLDAVEAQALYTAVMTDTMMEG